MENTKQKKTQNPAAAEKQQKTLPRQDSPASRETAENPAVAGHALVLVRVTTRD